MNDKRSIWPKIFAVVAVLLAGLAYFQRSGPAGAFQACAFLVFAWRLAFVGAPSLGMSVSDISLLKRDGRFTGPLTGKACDLAMGLLLLMSLIVPEQFGV